MKEEDRAVLLRFIDSLREAIVSAVALDGKWKIEKPSLEPMYVGTPYARWRGQNHTRYTCTIDILESQGSTSTAKREAD